MDRFVKYCILAITVSMITNVQAQDVVFPQQLTFPASSPELAEATPVHVSDKLNYSPEGLETLRRFHEMKRKGTLPKNTINAVVGDTVSWRIGKFNNFGNYTTFEPVEFRLEVVGPSAYLWVELSELTANGRVKAANLASLKQTFFDSTPATSYDPTKGLIDLNKQIFGNPPNSRSDGIVNILWYNIRDNYNGDTVRFFTGGFVTTADLPGGASQNGADILHVDTYPSLERGIDYISATAAHEFQHLIRLNYDRYSPTPDNVFQDEGQSEYASVLTGFALRSPQYLTVGESNISMFSWRGSTSPDLILDYQRAGLFATYIAGQVSPEISGEITRDTFDAIPALQHAIDKVSLPMGDLIMNFHTANVLNDLSVDSRFGYTIPAPQGPLVTPLTIYDDPTVTSIRKTANPELMPGGAVVREWRDVSEMVLTVDVIDDEGGTVASLRAQSSAVAVLRDYAGNSEVRRFAMGEEQTFSGDYSKITIIVANINPNPASSPLIETEFTARWSEPSSTKSIVYDSGALDPIGYVYFGEDVRRAVKFDRPAGFDQLIEASIGLYFLSHFNAGVPNSAARTFTLHVWGDDGTGNPGTELFRRIFTDNRAFQTPSSTSIQFFDVNLSELDINLAGQSGSIFVGTSSTGADNNFVVDLFSAHADQNTSFFGSAQTFGDAAFRQLWDLRYTDSNDQEINLTGKTFPIRARFARPAIVANEPDGELPTTMALFPNYPNPFNPSTTVSYALPAAGPVTLRVYDTLGRLVTTLQDGFQSAGRHQLVVDAANWASGLYVYTLQAGKQTLSGKMLLLK